MYGDKFCTRTHKARVVPAPNHSKFSPSLSSTASLTVKSLFWISVFIHIEVRTNRTRVEWFYGSCGKCLKRCGAEGYVSRHKKPTHYLITGKKVLPPPPPTNLTQWWDSGSGCFYIWRKHNREWKRRRVWVLSVRPGTVFSSSSSCSRNSLL